MHIWGPHTASCGSSPCKSQCHKADILGRPSRNRKILHRSSCTLMVTTSTKRPACCPVSFNCHPPHIAFTIATEIRTPRRSCVQVQFHIAWRSNWAWQGQIQGKFSATCNASTAAEMYKFLWFLSLRFRRYLTPL